MSDASRYRVTASFLNVRSGPSISFPPIAWLKRDEMVDWIETSHDGRWFEVRTDAAQGWCFAKYLEFVPP